jgi:hypothetical protein
MGRKQRLIPLFYSLAARICLTRARDIGDNMQILKGIRRYLTMPITQKVLIACQFGVAGTASGLGGGARRQKKLDDKRYEHKE